ncbi:MAG TPA: hypothetical protein VJT84_03490 [Gaiellaceae bacterium]|nr:hypothetical protein [Gaiellaceae bacterium]
MGATFVAECSWPDVRREQVEAGAERVRLSAAIAGGDVSFRGSLLLIEDEIVFYLFEGPSSDAVVQACRQASIPFERILGAVHLPPDHPARFADKQPGVVYLPGSPRKDVG